MPPNLVAVALSNRMRLAAEQPVAPVRSERTQGSQAKCNPEGWAPPNTVPPLLPPVVCTANRPQGQHLALLPPAARQAPTLPGRLERGLLEALPLPPDGEKRAAGMAPRATTVPGLRPVGPGPSRASASPCRPPSLVER